MYIDIHSHVIGGVDDGAETEEETREMLRAAVEDQIDTIILTPHITPGVVPFPQERFERHLEKAKEIIQEEALELTLFTGGEILYTEHTPRMLREGKIPTMAGSDYVLIEFDPGESATNILESLRKVASTGKTPILAHVERYHNLHTLKQIQDIKSSCRAKIQVNASTLLHKQPLLRRSYMEGIFKEKLVDLIATDTHSFRASRMTQGLEAMAQRYGQEAVERTQANGRRILPSGKNSFDLGG